MGIKPFDVRRIGGTGLINPEQLGYQDSLNMIREELHRTRRSFVKIGWYLKHIREKEMYKEEDYANIYELAADKFNLSQPTATRFINICEQFSIGHDSPELDEKYLDFNMSQLFEMLPMNPEEMSRVTPDMTVSQIRDYKKRNREEETVPDNEEIPGQTSIQKDFKEFMPNGYEEKKIIDGEYCEIEEERDMEDINTSKTLPVEEPLEIIMEFRKLGNNGIWQYVKYEGKEIIGIYSGKRDKNGKKIYSGDILQNMSGTKFEVRFGKHSMYCPIDDCMMENIGFYVVSEGYFEDMPLGPTEEYSTIIGNIFKNPDLKVDKSYTCNGELGSH